MKKSFGWISPITVLATCRDGGTKLIEYKGVKYHVDYRINTETKGCVYVRKRALIRFNELTEKLNESIIQNDDNYAKPNGFNHEVNLKGFVVLDSEDIQEYMDDLRMLIGTCAMTFEEENKDFADVFSQVHPDGDEGMTCFNPEIDQ